MSLKYKTLLCRPGSGYFAVCGKQFSSFHQACNLHLPAATIPPSLTSLIPTIAEGN